MEIKILKKGLGYAPIQNKIDEPELKRDFEGFVRQTRLKFHVNIITGSGIMTNFFCKGLTRNPEIRNTPVWVLPNIWRLERVMNTKFGVNVSNRVSTNATKF